MTTRGTCRTTSIPGSMSGSATRESRSRSGRWIYGCDRPGARDAGRADPPGRIPSPGRIFSHRYRVRYAGNHNPGGMPITGLPDVPLPCRIVALMQERNRLFGYPLETLADEIRQIGFTCSRCGTCCTRAVNRHIFLLDKDVDRARSIDSGAFEPAPAPEFCDQNGTLYVSGYALRMHDDDGGPCWFLHNNRCRIYEQRFPICRIYPHMLRRGADRAGNVAWCTFSRMHEHGRYDGDISYDKCLSLAREIKEYENGYL